MYFAIMTILDLFTKIYGSLHSSYLHYRLLTPFRFLVRGLANKVLPYYLSKPRAFSNRVEEDIIVSFTSFPARIGNVWQVIECLFRQTCLPGKIILWLSKEQFPSEESIPDSLLSRVNNRFEIRFVDGDIKSHKKYYYVAKQMPDKFILLLDDDIYYPTDLIEKTWESHLTHPDAVICNYGFHIKYEKDRSLKPYNQWERVYSYSCSNTIFFGSGGGTLIKPSMICADLINIDLAIKMVPIADDIWLNAMVNISRIKKVLLNNRLILPICIKDDLRLASQNRENCQNDKQLNIVIDYYLETMGVNPFDNGQ